MPKRTSTHDLVLHECPPGISLSHWLYRELRGAILAGRLPPGTRLPSTRDMARQWHVARSTVVTAFEQLRAEGYVHGTVGAGTVVAVTLPEDLLQVRVRQAVASAPHASSVVLSQRGQRLVTSPFPRAAPADISHPFRTGQPALDVFPCTLWNRLAARVQRQASRLLLAHGDARGYAPLREAMRECALGFKARDCLSVVAARTRAGSAGPRGGAQLRSASGVADAPRSICDVAIHAVPTRPRD